MEATDIWPIQEIPGFLRLCELGNPEVLYGSQRQVFPRDRPSRWLHMAVVRGATAVFLMDVAGLDDLVVETMTAEDTGSRLRVLNGGIPVLLKTIRLQDQVDPEDMVSLRIRIGSDRIITTCEPDVDPIHALRARILGDRRAQPSGTFPSHIIDLHIDDVKPYVEALKDAVSPAEQENSADTVD